MSCAAFKHMDKFASDHNLFLKGALIFSLHALKTSMSLFFFQLSYLVAKIILKFESNYS